MGQLKPAIHPAFFFQSSLPFLINLTLMDFVSSCFTLAVKVNYNNKTFFIVWQNDLSFVTKSKGFNKEIKLQDIG